MQLANATLGFRGGAGDDPAVDENASGVALGQKFTLYATGTLTHPMRFFVFDPPLTEKIIHDEIAGKRPGFLTPAAVQLVAPSVVERLYLHAPEEFFEGVDVVDWPSIPTPPPVPVTPPAATPVPAPAAAAPTITPAAPIAPVSPSTPAPAPTASTPPPPAPTHPAPAPPKP